MKKILPLLFVTVVLSCHSNTRDKMETFGDTSGAANTPGIDNVNGNIPDTSSGIKFNRSLPVDSSKVKDSTGH